MTETVMTTTPPIFEVLPRDLAPYRRGNVGIVAAYETFDRERPFESRQLVHT